MCESLLMQSRYIDADAFLKQAETYDTSKKHNRTTKKLRQIIQKHYSDKIIQK